MTDRLHLDVAMGISRVRSGERVLTPVQLKLIFALQPLAAASVDHHLKLWGHDPTTPRLQLLAETLCRMLIGCALELTHADPAATLEGDALKAKAGVLGATAVRVVMGPPVRRSN